MARSALFLLLAFIPTSFAAGDELDAFRPGLVAEYRSLVDPAVQLTRVDAKPAFTLGRSSPHPRLPAGEFTVRWSGSLIVSDPGPIRFSAFLCGEVKLTIDGAVVLDGRGNTESARIEATTPFDRPSGVYRLAMEYRSLPERPARLQLQWEGPTFSREPLPAWSLKHAASDETPAPLTEQTAEAGRRAIVQFGCARCHASGFPGIAEPPPGPSLADAARRIDKQWLLDWLADPAKVRAEAHMPVLFSNDRAGFVERWLVADALLRGALPRSDESSHGDHRPGRVQFISAGCAACHFLPDVPRTDQRDFRRTPLTGFADRLPEAELASFLGNPLSRYPDGRMPHVPLTPAVARDIAAYLLLWSKPKPIDSKESPPTNDEIQAVIKRLGSHDPGLALIRAKRCAECHPGLDKVVPADVPINKEGGCLGNLTLPRFALDEPTKKAIAAYRDVAADEKHASPFADRQRLLDRAGCVRCHQRDTDQLSPLEATALTLGGSGLETVPFQRAPRLTDPHQKYSQAHLLTAVRDGVKGLRAPRYTYLMPDYGALAADLVQALAESDGELVNERETMNQTAADPTLGSLAGPTLVGSTGYACISCHVWKGGMLTSQDPGSTGPDLTRVVGRIRREWFDRYLETPTRAHPGTPMPAIFPKGQPASLKSVLDGDPAKQKEALWSYFALGNQAPSPKPAPPLPIVPPKDYPLIAQMPVRRPNGKSIESITLAFTNGDLVVYDLAAGALHSAYIGAQILRSVQGRLRHNTIDGTLVGEFALDRPVQLVIDGKAHSPKTISFLGYERTDDGVRFRRQVVFESATIDLDESLSVGLPGAERTLIHALRLHGIPEGQSVELQTRSKDADVFAVVGRASGYTKDGILHAVIKPNEHGNAHVYVTYPLPPAKVPMSLESVTPFEPGPVVGSLVRPGYRAIAYPRPRTRNGDDLVMPGALAVNPKDGRVFVASMKSGEIYVLRDPTDDGREAHFSHYAGGIFQDCLAMLAEPDALYVLHRRNFTKITDDTNGRARKFERVAALPQGPTTESYDYAYGLVRDRGRAFVYTFAPYADTKISGAGGSLRFTPGKPPEEVAYGFRNPLGWCNGPQCEVFFTDNQGEWVATNKLCHIVPGRFYGFPNPQQPQQAKKPAGKTALWVPYSWAHSLNGVAYDNSGGKFGPFAGQFFIAELCFGGAIIRADLEKVNGEYQGACFPFWGQGLLGPLTLGFDPKGRLFVGSITEPGWMAQPDRGALYRIDFTGDVPFEMQSIRIRPNGFRVAFTRPVNPEAAGDPKSYALESWRYEYTGAYGSPELDRQQARIEKIEVAPDGLSAEITIGPVMKDRVYQIRAAGVRSANGELLVNPIGAYTVNEIPK